MILIEVFKLEISEWELVLLNGGVAVEDSEELVAFQKLSFIHGNGDDLTPLDFPLVDPCIESFSILGCSSACKGHERCVRLRPCLLHRSYYKF